MRFLKLPLFFAVAMAGLAAAPALASSNASGLECNSADSEDEQPRSEKRKDITVKPGRKQFPKRGQCRTCRILM